MKRTLSLLLCLLLIVSSVTFLFSCKKDDDDGDDPTTGGETQGIDLTGYSIVTGTELTSSGYQHAITFAKSLSQLASVEIAVFEDEATDVVENDDPEILIGETGREESTETYNEIEGDGWAVRVFEKTNKIAVVGTTPYLTRVALTWLEQTYLNAEHISGSTLSVQEKNVVSNLPILSLTEKVNEVDTTFTVVYETGKDEIDAPHQVMSKVCGSLSQKTGLTAQVMTADQDTVAKEILVGNMSRTDIKEEMAKIDADECAITVRDSKIYLVAWSDDTLPSAYELFEEMLYSSSYTDGNGNVVYQIPSNCTVVQSCDSDWFTDFPKPVAQGLYPEAAVDANDGCLQYIYSGSGATRETFVAYCETLKAAGYTPMENEDVQWEGSSFRTFVNNEKGVSLHVSHMAFSHAAEQNVTGLPNSIRIVSGYTDFGGTQVDAKYFRPQVEGVDYVKKINSRITSNLFYPELGDWGLGQILTLSDGSFIIIDGGNNSDNGSAELWELLRELHKEAHGSYPTKENPIHIRAWILTHEHGDHICVLAGFIDKYGQNSDLQFDYLMMNFGSKTQLRAANGNFLIRNNLKAYQEKVKNGFEYVQVNSGQVFYFANCRIEILVTIDDRYPWRAGEPNQTSMIFRTALSESDGTSSHETTSMWVGDARESMSQVARAMYGSFLKSEQVQVSHHGLFGVEGKFYDLVNAELVWLPDSVNEGVASRFFIRLDNPNTSWTVSAAFLNPNSKFLIFNGAVVDANAYPKWNVTLIMSPSGPQYDQIYDPITGADIEAKGSENGEPVLWPVLDILAYRAAIGK